MLSDNGLAEMRYRVAWSYYIENDDNNARRVAGIAKVAGGEWGTQSNWVFGLANWRLKDFASAFQAFDHVGRYANNDELRAAGLFWSARAAIASKQPQKAQTLMRNAAQLNETFYGLLSAETLGMTPAVQKIHKSSLDWKDLQGEDNIKIAVAMSSIGKSRLADEAIRHQAKIGDPSQHSSVAALAGALNLPATQLWMAHYGPRSAPNDIMTRYPYPNWTPTGGWRVDPALVYAHALQESAFRTSVISPAGARGLMQVRPGTAGDIARDKGIAFSSSDLDRPQDNLEYGQSYMEKLSRMDGTGGLLPKVIAAYNAGPAPVIRWNSEIRDNGDPLLFIESIPYWETRGYVSIILRNYWIYEMQNGKNGGSMTGLAQYLWPRFPQGGKNEPVRIQNSGGNIAAR